MILASKRNKETAVLAVAGAAIVGTVGYLALKGKTPPPDSGNVAAEANISIQFGEPYLIADAKMGVDAKFDAAVAQPFTGTMSVTKGDPAPTAYLWIFSLDPLTAQNVDILFQQDLGVVAKGASKAFSGTLTLPTGDTLIRATVRLTNLVGSVDIASNVKEFIFELPGGTVTLG